MSTEAICPECEVVMGSRTRHCAICNKCVERYDHHCPWINNCIGTKNHNIFYGLIVCLAVHLLIGIVMGITALVSFINCSCEDATLLQFFCEGKIFNTKVTDNKTVIMAVTIIEGIVTASLVVIQTLACTFVRCFHTQH